MLLVGGASDGTTVDVEGDVYGERLIDGYSEANIYGLPDPGHKWSSGELANVPIAVALNAGLTTVAMLVEAGGTPIMPDETRSAVFAAFAKWSDEQ